MNDNRFTSLAELPVLVTGGAGFIGSHLTHALVEAGARVRVLDNLATGHERNLAGCRDRIEFVEGDLRDLHACRSACAGAGVVFHLAALGSVPRSIADPKTSHDVNVTGTLNVLLAAKEAGVARVVYSSSSSVYGDTATPLKQEGMRPNPLSPYAATKLAGEDYCRAFNHTFGMSIVMLRYFNVFGPRQDPASQYAAVIPRFLTALTGGLRPRIYGDGSQSRDFTYVDNVVFANLLAGVGARAGVFNVACGERIVLSEVLATLQRLLGTQVEPEFEPSRAGDLKHSLADISAAREELGYEVVIPFTEGIRKTVHAFLSRGLAVG